VPKTITQPAGLHWVWIDLENPTPEELQEIAVEFKLPPSAVKDCLQPEHLPKYEEINEIVFIIARLHDLKAHAEADTIQELTSKIAIFITKDFLITLHRPPLTLVENMCDEYIEAGKTPFTFDLLLKILQFSFRTFEIPAQRLTAELDFYEAKTFLQRRIPPLTKGLYHLKRKAAVAKKVLQLSEVILDEIRKKQPPTAALQDLGDFHLRQITLYEELSDAAINLMNIYISLSSQKTNEVMRVLTVFSVFFMPLTFIVGIYGMNFNFMPELKTKFGYPGVMLAMFAVSIIIYFWFRRKGWL